MNVWRGDGGERDPQTTAYEIHVLLVETARRQISTVETSKVAYVKYKNLAFTSKSKEARRRICKMLHIEIHDEINLTMDLELFHQDLQISAVPGMGLIILDPFLYYSSPEIGPSEKIETIFEVTLAKSAKALHFVLVSGTEITLTLGGKPCSGGRRGKLLYPRSVKTENGRAVIG